MKKVIIILSMFLLTSCGTTYKVKSGEPYPIFKNAPSLGHLAGVIVSEDSTTSTAGEISTNDVATVFADKLREIGCFDTVIYPYTEHAHVTPDIIITLTINSIVDYNMAENVAKGFVVGASLFLLSPALPTRFETRLGIEAKVQHLDKTIIGTYAYEDIYEFKSSTLYQSKEIIEEWREESTRHLVENVIEEMLKAKTDFIE